MWYYSSEGGENSLNFSKPVLYPPHGCILLHLDLLEESCSCCILLDLPGSAVAGTIPTELQGTARTDLKRLPGLE